MGVFDYQSGISQGIVSGILFSELGVNPVSK